ncbi:hypothetical protein [Mycolicibacterium celeriflavum]|uniref:Uncharacterized protein n=1 Tax=Mycolicibacterium celeriflavum TaxID=1249101 RepID=A0A1X0C1E3_MYCCF|nr:hypothetical protein [Mycolicibacterium celeriflavum]MCV7238990.1 hypothetical protein [Mycolicibacterium celeriflavum]ORA50460.1 hypothetical protein BST21_04335 [Mycolicibacterium celeriflavum]BBY45230.1 hypothetical protein MCEL_35250 [Mycolicibacterium celeriflavum]
MSRTVAVIWHASFSVVAGVLYFFFVLPRWYELSGDIPHTLGTAMRIVVGALIGLAALPVVFTLLRTRRPEFGTPLLALRLRTWSIVFHVLAGVLILGAAISEIWLSLDDAGRWLFGIYGAAAAIALLGVFAFYLASVAEMPPPPPKPLKVKAPKKRRGRGKGAEEADEAEEVEGAEEAEEAEEPQGAEDASDASEASEETTVEADDEEKTAADEPDSGAGEPASTATEEAEQTDGKLRNRRPEQTRRRRRRLRGGVVVDD